MKPIPRPPSCHPAKRCRSSARAPGSWAKQAKRAADEATALRIGLDLGMTLIDTAEMYGRRRRRRSRRRCHCRPARRGVPGQQGAAGKCHRAAARLRPASAACGGWGPTGSTFIFCIGAAARRSPTRSSPFETLIGDGKIRHWGVSNFDTDDMEELFELPGGDKCATQPGALQSHPARPRIRSRCRSAASAAFRSWPIRRSSKAGCWTTPR